jgi:hypothetical protein
MLDVKARGKKNKQTASFYPEDGNSRFLQIVRNDLPNYIVSHARR